MAVSDPSLLPDEDELVVGEAVALDVRPASVFHRGAGTILDFLVTVSLALAVFFGIAFVIGIEVFDEALVAALVIAVLVIVLIVVPAVVETLTRGRSLGKWALGIRVVRDDGGAIGFRHALIRSLTGLLELWMTLGGLALLVGLLHPRGKRLGDLLAGTYAQVERVPVPARAVWGVPVELSEWATIADVAPLPDALARRISGFLGNASRMSPASRASLAAALATEAAPFVSPRPPETDPELFVAAVSALRRDREAEALRLRAQRMERLEPVLTGLPHSFPER